MSTNETALRLADALDNPPGAPLFTEAAAELRRLHAENEAMRAERQPLMDDQLCDLWYRQSLDWMEFARAIERAHGIGEHE